MRGSRSILLGDGLDRQRTYVALSEHVDHDVAIKAWYVRELMQVYCNDCGVMILEASNEELS